MKTMRHKWSDSIQMMFTDYFDETLSVEMDRDSDGVSFRCLGAVKLHPDQVRDLIAELQAWLENNENN